MSLRLIQSWAGSDLASLSLLGCRWFGVAVLGATWVVVAQPAIAQVSTISEFVVEPSDSGFVMQLRTSNVTAPKVLQSRTSDQLRIQIQGATLTIPPEQRRQMTPIPGVDSVELQPAGENGVVIIIMAPGLDVSTRLQRPAGSLLFNVVVQPRPEQDLAPSQVESPPVVPPSSPSDRSSSESDDDSLRITVTGEKEPGYRVPSSSTGTRTDTPIEDVPQSVQVVPSQVLEEQGVTTLTDSLRNFSGVTTGDIASGSSATSVIIRGFESNNIVRNGLRDQTLRFNAGSTNIDRIEVLKGPASVLFGVGDLGGLVNIVTKQPQSEPEYKLEFLGGAYGNYRPSLDFTGPLTADGDVNYRLNLAYQTQGSFKDFEERESYFFAPSIQVIDTDRTKLLLELEYLKETFEGLAPELPATGTVIKNPLGEVDVTKNLGEPSLARGETTQTRLGYRLSHELSSNWLLNNEFLVSFQDSPESTGITPINLTNNRLLRRFLTENPSQYTNYTFNANLIGEFPTGPIEHKLLLGFEWAQEKSDDTFSLRLLRDIDIFNPIYQPESLSARPITAFGQDATTEVSSLGLYVQDQMNLWSDRVILLLGGRFDIANQDFVDRFRAIPTAFDRQDQAFSPRVGLVLKPWENLSLYAGYNRSFKPAIGQNSQREVFIPEEGEQFEVGLKAKSPNNRLSSTLAFYNLKRSNVTTQDPDNPGFQLQVGEQQSRGFEFDLAGEIIPGWSLIGTYTYTDTEITKDNRFEVGNRLDNVPKHAASLWTTYQIQSGSLEGLGLGFGVFFEGDRAGDLNNNFDLPSYTRTDASIFYRRDRLTAQLNFKNLLNTRYFESSRDAFRVNPGPPFSIQGTLSWKF